MKEIATAQPTATPYPVKISKKVRCKVWALGATKNSPELTDGWGVNRFWARDVANIGLTAGSIDRDCPTLFIFEELVELLISQTISDGDLH